MAVPDSDVIFRLPLDAVCQSAGFSLDIGGSVAKLVYRSNEEYTLGKPHDEIEYQTGVGKLHLAMFARERIGDVISYLKQKCDVLKTEGFDSINCCGLGGNLHAAILQTEFHLRVQNHNEVDRMIDAICFLLSKYRSEISHEKSEEGIREAQSLIELAMNRYKKEDGEKQQYFEGDGTLSLDEKQGSNVQYPFTMAMMGSAIAYFTVFNSKGNYKCVDSTTSGGRFYLGMASHITKITDYNSLQKLVEESNASAVEILHKGTHLAGDVQHDIDDGSNTEHVDKADTARGLQEALCEVIAHGMHYAARGDNVRTIYCVGNFANPPVVKKWITKYITLKNALMPKDEEVRVQFIRHGGFMGALGAYLHQYLLAQTSVDTV